MEAEPIVIKDKADGEEDQTQDEAVETVEHERPPQQNLGARLDDTSSLPQIAVGSFDGQDNQSIEGAN